MAVRLYLPGRGALNLDAEQASLFNITLLEEGGLAQATAEEVQTSAVPRSYVDRGDIRVYDPTVTYAAQDYVIYEGRMYFANVEVMGITPMPRPNEVSQWSELERQDFFLQITADDGTILTANDHQHNVTITGGLGINTSADTDTETLSIDLNAGLTDLTDTDFTNAPQVNQILEYNGTHWVPVNNTGGGYSIVSADNGADVEVTNTRETINITGGDSSNPVSTTITSNDTETNVEISVNEVQGGAGGVPGLISVTDKDWVDELRARDPAPTNSPTFTGIPNAPTPSIDNDSTQIATTGFVHNATDLLPVLKMPSDASDLVLDQLHYEVSFWRPHLSAAHNATVRLNDIDVSGIHPISVLDDNGDTITLGPNNSFTIANTNANYTLVFNRDSIAALQQGGNLIRFAVRYNNGEADDRTVFGVVTGDGGGATELSQLSDVDNNLSPTSNQVLQYNGTEWTATSLADIEEHGGRAWNNATSYSEGDIVSFEVSGVDQLFISVTNNNISNQPIFNGVNSPQWQEASILRLRNIANIDITSDPADNDLIVWNATENEWMVMTPEMIVQLTTAITQGDIVLNAFNEITAITVGDTQRTIRQNAKSGSTLPATAASLAGDIFVLEGNNVGAHTDTFAVSDGTETTTSRGGGALGRTVLRFIASENQLEYIHNSDTPVTVNGRPIPIGGLPAGPGVITYEYALEQTLGQPLYLDFDRPSDFNDDDVITLTYQASTPSGTQGIFYRSADNRTWIRDTGGLQHGPRLPANAEAGDGFILTATEEDNAPGYYYYTTEWVKDDTDTAYTAGAGLRLSPGLEFSVDNPLILWNSTTTYDAGDQVLFDGGSNVNSIYISRTTNTNSPPVMPGNIDNTDNWFLVRSGIVSVGTTNNEGTTDAGGLTGNAQLNLNEGTGIQITRSGTTFTFAQRGTGHSDADDFGPGYAYSFTALFADGDIGLDEGLVTNESQGIIIESVHHSDDGRIIANLHPDSPLRSGDIDSPYGFSTVSGDGNSAGDLFSSLAEPDGSLSADNQRIVYVTLVLSGTTFDPEEIWLVQTDPRVDTTETLATQLGIPNRGDTRQIGGGNTGGFTLFRLDRHHSGQQYEPATWAREGNTDNIPLNKLQGLNQNNGVTRTAATQADELFTFDAGDDSSLVLLPHTVEGLTDTTITSPQAGQVLARNSDNDAWINMSVEEMAAGRLEFTDRGNNVWDTTGFITDPTDPNTITPIRTASFTNSLLRFQLATAANLTLNVPNYANFDWDETPSGTITATATRDDVLNVDLIDLTSANSNITISPSTGTGPWTVGYSTFPTSNAGATSTAGGSIGGSTFSANYSNDATRSETDTGAGITWLSTRLNVGNRNFGTTRSFLNPYPSYNIPISCDNISIDSSVTWTNGDTAATYNATPLIDGAGTTNVGLGTSNITVPLTIRHNDTISQETVAVTFRRPTAVLPSATAFTQTGTVNNMPNWNYPLFTFSATGTAAPVAVTIRDAATHGGSTNPSNAIGNQVSGISLTNSGSSSRFLYVAYPAASSDTPGPGDNFVVRLISTVGGVRGEAQNVTIAASNLSSASLNIFRDGGTAAEGEMYNWFRVLVGVGNSVDLVEVNPS